MENRNKVGEYQNKLRQERENKIAGLQNYLINFFSKYINKHGPIFFETEKNVDEFLNTAFDTQLKDVIRELDMNRQETFKLFTEAVKMAEEINEGENE